MRQNVDWESLEGQYRAGVKPVNALAKEYGVTEGAIRARAKKGGWLRDPKGSRREMVKAAMSGVTNVATSHEVRNIIENEADQDIADMRDGLAVARLCIHKLREIVGQVRDAREIKVVVEANKLAMETIRRIRGLDDTSVGGRTVEDILTSVIEKTTQR